MLKNVKKILLLLNLFQTRDVVTRQEAQRICDIKERSLYRYVSALSEIDIPVYYDYKMKGYRLSEKIQPKKKLFNAQEIVYLITGLHALMQHVSPLYRDEMSYLVRKIISLANFNLDDFIPEESQSVDESFNQTVLGKELTKSLIFLATTQHFPISITYELNQGEHHLEMKSPQILFDKEWYLTDHYDKVSIPIDKIYYIKLIR